MHDTDNYVHKDARRRRRKNTSVIRHGKSPYRKVNPPPLGWGVSSDPYVLKQNHRLSYVLKPYAPPPQGGVTFRYGDFP